MSKGAFGGIRKPSFDLEEIVGKLRGVDRNYRLKIWMSVLVGTALLPVGAVLITGFIWLYNIMFGVEIAFWGTYWMTLAVSTPLLFLLAWWVAGSVMEKGMPDAEGFGGRFMIKRMALALIVLEIATIGPRLIMHGVRMWRRRWAVGKVNIRRGGEAVVVLLKADSGVNPVQLVNENDAEGTLMRILGFLMLHDLADVAKTSDRVWLRSSAREKLLGK